MAETSPVERPKTKPRWGGRPIHKPKRGPGTPADGIPGQLTHDEFWNQHADKLRRQGWPAKKAA